MSVRVTPYPEEAGKWTYGLSCRMAAGGVTGEKSRSHRGPLRVGGAKPASASC